MALQLFNLEKLWQSPGALGWRAVDKERPAEQILPLAKELPPSSDSSLCLQPQALGSYKDPVDIWEAGRVVIRCSSLPSKSGKATWKCLSPIQGHGDN